MVADLNPVLANGLYNHVAYHNGVTIQEKGARAGATTATGQTGQRTWLVRGTSNQATARAALVDGPVLINQFDGMNIESLSHTMIGPQDWEFTAQYNVQVPEIGGYTVSIDTSGGQIMQTSALSQTNFAATGETAAFNPGNSIDIQEGRINGVERIIPALTIHVRARVATEYLLGSPMAYSNLIASRTGTINNASAFGSEFEAGELLFAGATGEVIAENPTLTFTFLASANLYSQTIGNVTGINKPGWSYLWFSYKPGIDASTNLKTAQVRSAHVATIYGTSNFSDLSIGLAPT